MPLFLLFAFVLLWLQAIAAYITHIVWSIRLLTGDGVVPTQKIILAGIGLLPPVGIIHGWLIWVGIGG